MAYYRRSRDPRQGLIVLGMYVAFLLIGVFYVMVVGVETTADVFGVLLGKGAIYDEAYIQEYLEEERARLFADAPTDDQVLIVILVSSDYSEYHYAVSVGDHVAPEIAGLYRGEDQTLGSVLKNSITRGSFEKTLNNDLKSVIKSMNYRMSEVRNESPTGRLYTCDRTQETYRLLENHTELKLGGRNLDRALAGAGLPTVIVVEDMRDVYGYHVPLKELFIAITTLLAIAGIVLLIVYLIRKPPTQRESLPEGGRRQEGTDYIEKLDDDHWEQQYDQDFSE